MRWACAGLSNTCTMRRMAHWADEFEHEEQLAEIAGILNAQHARLVAVAARALRDGGWFGEGIHSFQPG